MSRVSDKSGTKAEWRRGKSRTYGVAAHRRVRQTEETAKAARNEAQKRKKKAAS